MAQSYLGGDRFGALDSSFQTGIQLGTQIVRERLERQQKLQDQQTQQQAELAAEKNRADLELRNNAEKLHQVAAANAQARIDLINDPVQNRKNLIDDYVKEQTTKLDAQDARTSLVLNPNDAGFTTTARSTAQQLLQNNNQIRAGLNTFANQPVDATKPISYPTSEYNSNNEVTTQLTPDQLYTPEFRASQNKGESITPLQQSQIDLNNARIQHLQSQNTPGPGGLRPADIRSYHKALWGLTGALRGYNANKDVPLDMAGNPSESAQKVKNAYAKDYNTNIGAALSAYTNPAVIQQLTGASQSESERAAKFAGHALSKYGDSPSPEQLNEFYATLHGFANPISTASPIMAMKGPAQLLLKTGSIPYAEDTQTSSDQEDSQ